MASDTMRFGDFELDRSAYQLRRNSESLPIERIPLDLLFLLIDRRGELVTRGEIFEQIWGKQIFVDTDNAINTAILVPIADRLDQRRSEQSEGDHVANIAFFQ